MFSPGNVLLNGITISFMLLGNRLYLVINIFVCMLERQIYWGIKN